MITDDMRKDGVVYERETETGVIYVIRMLFNHRLTFGPPYDKGHYEDCWCYATSDKAIAAAESWDPNAQEEPDGWNKHPFSGRYRPGQ